MCKSLLFSFIEKTQFKIISFVNYTTLIYSSWLIRKSFWGNHCESGLPSWHGGSPEITLTVPLRIEWNIWMDYFRTFADTHACQELQKRSHKFALQNFQEVMNTEEFLLLPYQQVEYKSIKARVYIFLKNYPPIFENYLFSPEEPPEGGGVIIKIMHPLKGFASSD